MLEVRHFARNTVGRDFIVGDVHGCFDLLRDALARVGFDEARDRLFATGDLVDRGPSSLEVLDWIERPWFFSVRGNHEQMAIGVAAGRHDLVRYSRNGGGWFLGLPIQRMRLVASVLDTLPHAIEIDHIIGRVGIVHANVPMPDWDALVSDMESPTLSRAREKKLEETLLWSRARYTGKVDCTPVAGLAALFVGHEVMPRASRLGNVCAVDTGAAYGRYLTVLNIADAHRIEPYSGATAQPNDAQEV